MIGKVPIKLPLPEAMATMSMPKSSLSPSLHVGSTKPFGFLDLPKEIRQIIYRELRPITQYHGVYLKDGQKNMTLVCTTIPGISVLATCRQIYEEARYILDPLLNKILATSPTITIMAHDLLSFMDPHNSISFPSTFWNWFTRLLKYNTSSSVRSIHRYRDGKISSAKLLRVLDTKAFTQKDMDARMLKALTEFLLRTIRYAGTKPKPMFTYPPVTVVVEITERFFGIPVTVTTSIAKLLAYKITAPGSPVPRRVLSGIGDIPWLLFRLAYETCYAAYNRRDISLDLRLRFLGVDKAESRWPWWCFSSEDQLHADIINGVRAARSGGRGLFYYGGVLSEKIEDEF